jgi:hypothetical protein
MTSARFDSTRTGKGRLAAWMLTISVNAWRELPQWTVREATEWSLPVWEGAASSARVVFAERSSA